MFWVSIKISNVSREVQTLSSVRQQSRDPGGVEAGRSLHFKDSSIFWSSRSWWSSVPSNDTVPRCLVVRSSFAGHRCVGSCLLSFLCRTPVSWLLWSSLFLYAWAINDHRIAPLSSSSFVVETVSWCGPPSSCIDIVQRDGVNRSTTTAITITTSSSQRERAVD